MRGGGRRPIAGPSLALVLLSSLLAHGSPADPAGGEGRLEQLMARLATSRGLHARFEERIESPLLAEPLSVRGWLAVDPPDRLARVTESPEPSRLVLEGESIRLETPGAPPVDLGADPAARAFLLEFARLFRGDLPGLRERYALGFRVDGTAFELSLTPRSEAVRRRISRVVLAGEDDVVRRIEVHEPGGGRTTTQLLDVDPDRALSAEETARFFGPPGAAGSP